jgi:hypothetical protein
MQLSGCGDGPLLSLGDRCGPMLRARRGTAGEDDVARSLAVIAPAPPIGEARPGRHQPRSQAADAARQARTRHELMNALPFRASPRFWGVAYCGHASLLALPVSL